MRRPSFIFVTISVTLGVFLYRGFEYSDKEFQLSQSTDVVVDQRRSIDVPVQCLSELYFEVSAESDTESCQIQQSTRSSELIITNDRGHLPYVTIRNQTHDNIDRVYVIIVGGPLDSISSNIESYLGNIAVMPNELFVVPAYTGTRYRTFLDPNRDLTNAVQEINLQLREIRFSMPDAEINVVGLSYGSLVASRLNHSYINRLLYISAPVGFSGSELLSFFTSNSSERKRQIDRSLAISAANGARVFLNRYDYMRDLLISIGQSDVVSESHVACTFYIFGNNDPLFNNRLFFGNPRIDQGRLLINQGAGHRDAMEDNTSTAQPFEWFRNHQCAY